MFLLLNTIFAAEPSATLLVSPDGGYLLNISLKKEWENAEVSIDQPIGNLFVDNFVELRREGVFDTIPEQLNINMTLANGNEGTLYQTSISPVFLPFKTPSLSGDTHRPLQEYSLAWKWYRFFYSHKEK